MPFSNPAVLVAASKGLERLLKDVKLTPGPYPIDEIVTLQVIGDVTKAEDGEYTPTADIPLLLTMAFLLQRAGITRARSKALLIECAKEALAAGEQVGKSIATRIADCEAAVASVKAAVAAELPKKIRSGAVRFNGIVKELSAAPAEPVALA